MSRLLHSWAMLSSIVLLYVVTASCLAQSKLPLRGPLIDDPSLVPLPGEGDTSSYRWRAYGDIDKDGVDDLILSVSLNELSRNGLTLYIYVGDSSGQFSLYDEVFNPIDRLGFERGGRGIKLWTYWHHGGGEGSLRYSFMTDSGLVDGDGIKLVSGGRITEAIYETVFGNSDVAFRIERYRIVNGEVEVAVDH